MLRIATVNVNGIRSAQRRGFEQWRDARDCDVIALQEVRCPLAALPRGVFGDYHLAYDPGTSAGRNGVAVLTRHAPAAVRSWGAGVLLREPGEEHDEPVAPHGGGVLARELRAFAQQGRYIEVDLADRPLTVASLYLPKGGLPAHLQDPRRMREAPDGGAKYARKMSFLTGFARHLTRARRAAGAAGREFLLLGDLNVAHTRHDVANWRRNQNAEGFLPEERDWMTSILGPRRLVDVVRALNPDVDGPYSWWSWMGRSFEKDVGWRIDYHLASPRLARAATAAGTDRDPAPDQRLSDHAPVVVDYRW